MKVSSSLTRCGVRATYVFQTPWKMSSAELWAESVVFVEGEEVEEEEEDLGARVEGVGVVEEEDEVVVVREGVGCGGVGFVGGGGAAAAEVGGLVAGEEGWRLGAIFCLSGVSECVRGGLVWVVGGWVRRVRKLNTWMSRVERTGQQGSSSSRGLPKQASVRKLPPLRQLRESRRNSSHPT